jgi:hypothetical protein
MKKITLKTILAAVFLSAAVSANAQEYHMPNRAEFVKQFPQLDLVNLDDVPLIVKMPTKREITLFNYRKTRFGMGAGCGIDVNLGMSDGVWNEVDGKRIWTLRLSAPSIFQNIRSIWVSIRKFHLAPNALMYAYSPDGKFLEISNSSFNIGGIYDGDFATVIERSAIVVIQIVEPANSSETSTLEIPEFSVKTFSEEGLPLPLSCNEDVACRPNWKKDSYGICQIRQINTHIIGSGALINNTKADCTPYILSAFHVFDDDNNGILDANEKVGLMFYEFRFHYRTKECNNTVLMKDTIFFGSTFRAAYQPSDMILVELDDFYSAIVDSLVFLGWDKRSTAPNWGITLHHPDGDTMKISYDNSSSLGSNTVSIQTGSLIYPAGMA